MFPTRIGAWASSFLFRFDEHIAHFQELSSNESFVESILELIPFDSTRARPEGRSGRVNNITRVKDIQLVVRTTTREL